MIEAVRPRPHRASHSVVRVVAVWFSLLAYSCRPAVAGDVVVNYAVEANDKTGSGRLENCDDERMCHFRAADLDFEIVVYPGPAGVAMMDMVVRGGPGCCYTVDAERRFHAIVKSGFLRLAIYRRMSADRDDFVMNAFSWDKRIGTVHLGFSQTRSAKSSTAP